MKKSTFRTLYIYLFISLFFIKYSSSQNPSCSNFSDFITACIGNADSITFSAGISGDPASVTNPGNNYDCLGASPNPVCKTPFCFR